MFTVHCLLSQTRDCTMPKKVSSQKKGKEEVVDFKEMYKNKKRKELKSKIEKPAQKKAKENPRTPKEFKCPYCSVTISGWVVCRHHIFAKHGVVATRAELLDNTLPPAKITTQEDDAEDEDDEGDDDEEEVERGDDDSDSDNNSGSEDEEDGWIANAKHFWTRHLQKIEEESERKVTTQQIFDKNSKKKFRPEFMSKKEYVRHVIEAMKEDDSFLFDAANACFTLVDVEEGEEVEGEKEEDEEDDSDEEEE